MKHKAVTINIPGQGAVSGILAGPDHLNENSSTGIVFAHGMSNDMNHPSLQGVAQGLADLGYITLRFNFFYKEKGRKSADPDHRLIACWKAALDYLLHHSGHGVDTVVAAGKSLGARIASLAAASGEIIPHHIIFLGYPLHAPGRKENLRDAHLPAITVPMLFFEGTRDPFCDLDLLSGVIDRLPAPVELEIIQGGDHGFNLPASDPREPTEVHRQIVEKCHQWLCR
ncbi:MAG: dienelactone hydrolase family protein [Desulfobacterium sp.]